MFCVTNSLSLKKDVSALSLSSWIPSGECTQHSFLPDDVINARRVAPRGLGAELTVAGDHKRSASGVGQL